MALRLEEAFLQKGYKLYADSPTNLQFFIVPDDKIRELKKAASFEYWGRRAKRRAQSASSPTGRPRTGTWIP